jgi:hypothetical protein
MKPGFLECIYEAFAARPSGMWIPPNWIALSAFGLLGLLNPGFWIIGAGLELGYLYVLTSHSRFQRYVAGKRLAERQNEGRLRFEAYVAQLGQEERRRFHFLDARCRAILGQQVRDVAPGSSVMAAQGESLSKLLQVYLRLLLTRQTLLKIQQDSADSNKEARKLELRLAAVKERLAGDDLTEELRKSLTGQAEIMQQRMDKRKEAANKIAFLNAELARLEEQVELIREQAALSADPQNLSERIDGIIATLDGTSQWIQEQRQFYGQVEELLVQPPPLTADEAQEAQSP